MKIIFYILFLVILVFGQLRGQDVHFSQFEQNPMRLNPANTGMFEGNFRFGMNYKNQWANIGSVYETYAASTDFVVLKNSMGLKSTGVGFSAYQDVAGSSNTKTTRIDLNISQTVYLSENSDLTLGVGFSYLDMSANFSGLTWGSMYNGVEVDRSLGSGEIFTGYVERAFDLSAGMLFRVFDRNSYPLQIGVSADHLTQPTVRLLSVDDIIPIRINVNVSKEFDFRNNNSFGYKLLAYGATQRRAREIIVGGLLRRDFGMKSKYTGYYNDVNVYFGAYYRVNDAIIPVVQVSVYQKLLIGMSYDFTVSQLSNASLFRGGPELTLSYISPFRPIAVVSPKNFD